MASKNSSGEAYGKGRTRNFATIVYPESAPENWESILSSHFVSAFISPLHNNDVNPTGEPKKPHYHVIIMFDTVKTSDQAQEIFNSIGGVGCEPVKCLRNYARYLCHLDNLEKAQYPTSDVKCIYGADYLSVISSASDKYVAIGEMQDFCDRYNVVSFYALSKYARVHRPDWHRILCDSGSVFMREYLQSRKWSTEQGFSDIVDPDTGDILS